MGRTLASQGRRTRRGLAVLALCGVVALVAGCAGSTSGAANARHPGPSRASPSHAADTTGATGASGDPNPAPLHWSSCGTDLQCATLVVPLDYAHPGGATVSLAVIRRPARDSGQRVGALVVNPGGPGASGVGLVRAGFGVANGFDQQLDIVSWDPRGVGASAPLDCGRTTVGAIQHLDADPPTPAWQDDMDHAAEALAADCGQHAGPLLAHLDSDTTARDMEQLRKALGEPKLTYAGYSYGTALGLAYARRYPTHVRAMVLDGVVDPDANLDQLLSAQSEALEQSLQRIFDGCTADADCPLHDASATYDRLDAELATRPLQVDGHQVGPAELATAAVQSTYSPDTSARPFLEALAAAAHGDGSGLERLAEAYRQAVPDYQTYLATMCDDVAHPVGQAAYQAMAAQLEARSPRLGAAVADELFTCAYWLVPETRRPAVVSAPGSPPILVVGNTGDAATPLTASIDVARHLAHGVLLTYDGEGHTSVDRSRCVSSSERRYLTDLTVPPTHALCASGT